MRARTLSFTLSCSVLALSAVARAQPAPASPQSAPPSPSATAPQTPDAPRPSDDALAKRLAELEARVAASEKREADAESAKRAVAAKADEEARAKAAKEQADKAAEAAKPAEPFAFGDFSWVPGGYAPHDHALAWGPFTGELRVDAVYHYSFSNPLDDTISGSSEVFRHNEFQVTQLGFGGDFLYKGVQARLMTQFGMYSTTTPRNDASPGKGNWDLANAYRYISEAYGGYHIDALNGINIQAGIFMSYVGLWSYYNYDNWTYQPSYVSSNTPWFFNGVRVQFFPSDKLKIEPWLVNGWQSYGKFNETPGVGLQILYRPYEWLSMLGNQYFGADTLGVPDRKRVHTDDSIMVRYYDAPTSSGLSRAAASLTVDAGCEFGDGNATGPAVTCSEQYFVGFMAYTRAWFEKNQLALTVGGGAISNPGRYLVLIPPINGATAFSGTPYFTANKGDPFKAWDLQITGDYIPQESIIFRAELNHRAANVPYFTGHGGVTPPGGNQGAPGSAVQGWSPDLVNSEDRLTFAMLVRL